MSSLSQVPPSLEYLRLQSAVSKTLVLECQVCHFPSGNADVIRRKSVDTGRIYTDISTVLMQSESELILFLTLYP